MPIYIRDLKDTIRLDVEEFINKSGNKELIACLDDGRDILLADLDEKTLEIANDKLEEA